MKNIVKYFIGFIFSLMITGGVFAQDCEAYFPMEEGAFVETKQYNKKDKLTGTSQYTVIEKEEAGNLTMVKVHMNMKDEKDKEIMDGDMDMICEDGVFYVDMKKFLDPSTMQMGGEDAEVTIDANNMEIPANPEVGQELGDGYIKVSFASAGMPLMNITVNIINRKVDAIEDVTTPAGTYNCVKISYDIETKTFMTMRASGIEWYARDVGVVRSESYNGKGKLTGYSILNDIKLP